MSSSDFVFGRSSGDVTPKVLPLSTKRGSRFHKFCQNRNTVVRRPALSQFLLPPTRHLLNTICSKLLPKKLNISDRQQAHSWPATESVAALSHTSCTAAIIGIFSRSFCVTATRTVITLAAGPSILIFTITPSTASRDSVPPPVPTKYGRISSSVCKSASQLASQSINELDVHVAATDRAACAEACGTIGAGMVHAGLSSYSTWQAVEVAARVKHLRATQPQGVPAAPQALRNAHKYPYAPAQTLSSICESVSHVNSQSVSLSASQSISQAYVSATICAACDKHPICP